MSGVQLITGGRYIDRLGRTWQIARTDTVGSPSRRGHAIFLGRLVGASTTAWFRRDGHWHMPTDPEQEPKPFDLDLIRDAP